MSEGRSGGSGRGTRRENRGPHLTAVLLTDGSQVCIVYPTLDPKPFPAPPSHFLPSAASSPAAPACWPQGKILPHPSARSARHSSPQDGGPKGKMIEGRSGGSGRGTRRESWAPPDSGSAHRRIAGLYRVLDSRPESFPAPPSHFLPSAASSPSHLPAGHGEKFCRTQAHVQLGTRLRRMAGPKGK